MPYSYTTRPLAQRTQIETPLTTQENSASANSRLGTQDGLTQPLGTNLSLVATQLPGLQPKGMLENSHPTSPGIVAEKLCEVLNPQFEFVKFVPLSVTSEVRDRWLRPFVAATGPAHRVLSLSSKELLEFELLCSSRHLRQDKTLPLFMHPQ